MFKIVKKASGFWHYFYNDTKAVNISDFNVVLDIVAQTFIIQSLNGSNVPSIAVPIANIEVIDETDASLVETFATVELLRTRLVALAYTPYLSEVPPSGGSWGTITGTLSDQVDLWNELQSKATKFTIRPTQSGTTYTLVLADANSLTPFDNSANRVVTIPLNATVAFDIGTQIVLQSTNLTNAGLTVDGAVGVTLDSPLGNVVYYNSSIKLTKKDTNLWLVEAMPISLVSNVMRSFYSFVTSGNLGADFSYANWFVATNGLQSPSGAAQLGIGAGEAFLAPNVPLIGTSYFTKWRSCL